MDKTYLKSIKTGAIGLPSKTDIENLVESNPNPVDMFTVFGYIEGIEQKQASLGPYILFKGKFECQNLISKQAFRSQNLIIPSLCEGFLYDSFQAVKKSDENARCKFAVTVTAKENKSTYENNTKFSWGFKSLVEDDKAASDELSDFLSLLPQSKILKELTNNTDTEMQKDIADKKSDAKAKTKQAK